MKTIALAAALSVLASGAAFAQAAGTTGGNTTTTAPAASGTMAPNGGAASGTMAPNGAATGNMATGNAATGNMATGNMAAGNAAASGDFVTLPPMQAGQMPTMFRAGALDDKDVYGANDEKVGEIDDFVFDKDGSIQAVILEVGGFLGLGQKDVLVKWSSLQMTMDGDDVRVSIPSLTRDTLTNAPDVDLDALGLDD